MSERDSAMSERDGVITPPPEPPEDVPTPPEVPTEPPTPPPEESPEKVRAMNLLRVAKGDFRQLHPGWLWDTDRDCWVNQYTQRKSLEVPHSFREYEEVLHGIDEPKREKTAGFYSGNLISCSHFELALKEEASARVPRLGRSTWYESYPSPGDRAIARVFEWRKYVDPNRLMYWGWALQKVALIGLDDNISYTAKLQVVQDLEAMIRRAGGAYRDARLRLFGSLAMGVSDRGSDIDVIVEMRTLPGASGDDACKVSNLSDILHKQGLRELEAVTGARVPIVAHKAEPQGSAVARTQFDLAFRLDGARKTYLLRRYVEEGGLPVRIGLMTVRLWAKSAGLLGRGHLTSYAITIMFIHYLIRHGEVRFIDPTSISRDMGFLPYRPPLPELETRYVPSDLCRKVGQLVVGFWVYYAFYDPSHPISISSPDPVPPHVNRKPSGFVIECPYDMQGAAAAPRQRNLALYCADWTTVADQCLSTWYRLALAHDDQKAALDFKMELCGQLLKAPNQHFGQLRLAEVQEHDSAPASRGAAASGPPPG
eukprot:TRINITY_DN43372_c0_g1_i1.p1 TRINITY_DN43372_c0_g1~~TRINITY_DN43372_c0_g1_i1.p1  ORF type:complete len:552 (+),score=144.14 TRINITY_DN43372_c0_g1_i1:42-1658(+)